MSQCPEMTLANLKASMPIGRDSRATEGPPLGLVQCPRLSTAGTQGSLRSCPVWTPPHFYGMQKLRFKEVRPVAQLQLRADLLRAHPPWLGVTSPGVVCSVQDSEPSGSPQRHHSLPGPPPQVPVSFPPLFVKYKDSVGSL